MIFIFILAKNTLRRRLRAEGRSCDYFKFQMWIFKNLSLKQEEMKRDVFRGGRKKVTRQ